MTLTLIYMALPAYLLVGCLFMLLVNELASGAVTRKEFLSGMLIWPQLLWHFVSMMVAFILTSLRG